MVPASATAASRWTNSLVTAAGSPAGGDAGAGGRGVGERGWAGSLSGAGNRLPGPLPPSAATARRHAVTPPRRSAAKPSPNACPRWCSAAWRSCS